MDTSLCFTHPSAARIQQIHRSLIIKSPRNLHVLSTPPAFILSQDQTLRKNFFDFLARLTCLASLHLFLCQGATPYVSRFNVNVRLAQCKRNDTPCSKFCLYLLLDFFLFINIYKLYCLYLLYLFNEILSTSCFILKRAPDTHV